MQESEAKDELINLMTIMYLAMPEVVNDRECMASVHEKLRE
jgi:hypothetical protein